MLWVEIFAGYVGRFLLLFFTSEPPWMGWWWECVTILCLHLRGGRVSRGPTMGPAAKVTFTHFNTQTKTPCIGRLAPKNQTTTNSRLSPIYLNVSKGDWNYVSVGKFVYKTGTTTGGRGTISPTKCLLISMDVCVGV